MKVKKFIIIILLIFSTTMLFGCTNKKEEKTIEVTDMLGDTISIKEYPKKVACVSRTTYDLLIAFGLGDKIDGAYKTIYDNSWTEIIYPNSRNEYKYQYNESYETFITRGVDLVFAPEKYISDGLKEHGVNALCFSLYGNPTYDEYVFSFANVVKQLWPSDDVIEKVDEWIENVNKSINDIKAELNNHNLEKLKVFYVRGDKNKGIGYTDSKSSFTEYAYRILGFEYAGATLNTTSPSKEDICSYNPDLFVVGGIYQNTLVELLKTSEPYNQLDSVKNNKIITIPVGLTMFEQLSVMTPIFFYDQANKIYPEYFNYDIKSMVKNTIKKYFGTELSDEYIEYMLNGKDYNGENLA